MELGLVGGANEVGYKSGASAAGWNGRGKLSQV